MKRSEARSAMAAANPLGREQAADLPLAAAEDELLAEIVAGERPEPAPPRRRQPVRRRGPRRVRFALAVTAAASGLLAFLLLSSSDGGPPAVRPSSAYAAELIRRADSSPRLLLTAPGWRVAGLQAWDGEGEMQFAGPSTGPAATGRAEAQLNWLPAALVPLERRVHDRALSAELATTAPALDTTARVFQYIGSRPGRLDVTALWEEGGLVVEYRAPVPSVAAFEAQLASLRKVDTESWLAAMPPDVVKPAEFEATVRQMLVGVAMPPGFVAADVVAESVPTDRYQLSASVVAAVGCSWFARWAEARRSGDEAAVKAAIAAMSGSQGWPVVRQMSDQGAFDQILHDLALAMPRGSVYRDRPLENDVESALACGRMRGIPIPGTRYYQRAVVR